MWHESGEVRMVARRSEPTARRSEGLRARAGLAAALLLASLGPGCDAGRDEALPTAITVRVTGEDFRWRIRYPGADGLLDTPDDIEGEGDVHLPADTVVTLELRSTDYIYGFRIPDFGVNEMAIPELQHSAGLFARSAGAHELRGDQMCGFRHQDLLRRVIIHPPRDYSRWIEEQGR